MAAAMRRWRIAMPSSAVTELRTAITHPMENGHRRDASGAPVPCDTSRLFTANSECAEVFRVEAHTALLAGAYFA
ncbi:thiosulfate oxidation carrier complex protein SoxZ [Elioraea tepidiphila]|jgi:hypothetical protein|uniref:thiosulfate oxidation carrier complex protein SoxZ n=1 Tax=Elioraea tepidiphila TaxID=457934 RepID=UPI002FD8DAE2